MKVKKESVYKIIIGILILLQFAEIVLGANYYFSNKIKPTYNPDLVTYLLNNYSSKADIFDTEKYDLFVSGEAHATQKNYDVQMEMIKHLSENSDLRYIIAEDSMANALLINSYLETGNTDKLDIVFKELKNTYAGNIEGYKFFQNLYEFRKTLPDDKKFTYLGVDIEHQTNLTVSYLYDVASRNGVYENIKEFIENFKQKKEKNELISSLEKIYSDIEKNSDVYSEKLGEEFWIFKYLIKNTLNTYKSKLIKDGTQWGVFREEIMKENFYEIYNHFPKGKYYGQWGLEHAYLSNLKTDNYPEDKPRLATALNSEENSPVKNKVCSTAIRYFDSFQTNLKGFEPEKINNPVSNNYSEIDSLKLFAQDSIQFFKLDSEGSPFSKELYFIPENSSKSGVTTDYFKNIIVVKNSSACGKLS